MEGTVFVVDEDQRNCDSIKALVSSMGLKIATFHSSESFLSAYSASQSGCLVTEIRMRGMGGLELIDHLSATNRQLPTIVVTAFARTVTTVRAMQAGVLNVYEKPFDEDMLWQSIQKALKLDEQIRAKKIEVHQFQQKFVKLSQHERDVASMIERGLTNRQIADQQDVSTRTVETRRHNLFAKLGVNNVPGLVSTMIHYRDYFEAGSPGEPYSPSVIPEMHLPFSKKVDDGIAHKVHPETSANAERTDRSEATERQVFDSKSA